MAAPELSYLKNICFVLDTSQSARECFNEIRKVFLNIYWQIPSGTNIHVYLISTAKPLTDIQLEQIIAGEQCYFPSYCSLIAPVFNHLLKQIPLLDAIIVIGNGEIFDLEDYHDQNLAERLILIKVGSESLQSSVMQLPEITPAQSREAERLLATAPSPKNRSFSYLSGVSDLSAHRWRLDRTGYPMVWIEPINCFVHLFPVSKIQFERFITSSQDEQFNDQWYSERLSRNLRVSARNIREDNYEHLFATNITTAEIEHFAGWLKQGHETYFLLNTDEWQQTYQWLSTCKPTLPPPEITDSGVLSIWYFIQTYLTPQSLAQLALMTGGVMEWVISKNKGREKTYGGLGLPRLHFTPQPFRNIFELATPFTNHLWNFGFRLGMR